MNYKHAPPMVKFEYKSEGNVTDTKEWILYKNWTDLQKRAKP